MLRCYQQEIKKLIFHSTSVSMIQITKYRSIRVKHNFAKCLTLKNGKILPNVKRSITLSLLRIAV